MEEGECKKGGLAARLDITYVPASPPARSVASSTPCPCPMSRETEAKLLVADLVSFKPGESPGAAPLRG